MATNGDDGKFYGPVHSVYIPFSKINGDYAFFLSFSFFLPLFFFSFLFFIENKILTMDFSAFYDISNLESFHDKLRLSRLDLSSAISSKDRLIDSSIDRRICRLIVSLELILISPNLRFRPPSPFFYDRFRSFLVTRNDERFFYDEQKWFQPMFPTWTRAIVLSSSTVATCFRFNRFLLERKTLGNASKRVFDQR